MDKDQEVYFDQDQYGSLGFPSRVLIDRDGTIRKRIRSERERDAPDMKKKIEMLFTKKKGEGK